LRPGDAHAHIALEAICQVSIRTRPCGRVMQVREVVQRIEVVFQSAPGLAAG